MTNIEVRTEMRKMRIFSYEVAAELGIAETSLSRKMRKELSQEEKKEIIEVIHKLAKREVI